MLRHRDVASSTQELNDGKTLLLCKSTMVVRAEREIERAQQLRRDAVARRHTTMQRYGFETDASSAVVPTNSNCNNNISGTYIRTYSSAKIYIYIYTYS